MPKNQENRDWAADLVYDIEYFLQDLSSTMKMDEISGEKDVSWRELILRMSNEDVEKIIERLRTTADEYNAYFHSEAPCPGVPV
jgi:hypothetical protein